MTAEDKIRESEYNLDKLKGSNSDQDFNHILSNFLSSSHSILEHLLEDHNEKFGFNLDYITAKIFRDKANNMKNIAAIKFIDWYIDEKAKLRNEESYGFLWAKRNQTVHTKTVKPDHGFHLELKLTPIWKDKITGERTRGDSIPKERTWYFFNENTNEDAITVCEKFLSHIKRIVNASQEQEKPL